MKRMKFVGIFLIILVLFSVAIFFMMSKLHESGQGKNEKIHVKEEMQVSEENNEKSLEDTLEKFAKVLYTYDTRERMQYEGCEPYMTEKAYQKMIPMKDPEAKKMPPIAFVSKLKSVEYYFDYVDDKHVRVLMEVTFTTSAASENETWQLMKLNVEEMKEDWKITSCEVMDTIEH